MFEHIAHRTVTALMSRCGLGVLCPADIDGNGAVDFQDILRVLVAWGPCNDCLEDLDRDGEVDFADLLIVIVSFGDCA